MRKINIGIIGCGYWGPNFVRNFNSMGNVNVLYASDLHQNRLDHINELYPHIKTTQNYNKILNDKNIDAVIISTPAVTHYKLTRDALICEKHVLVEKPIAYEMNQAKELINLAEFKKKILMVGHTFKFNPGVNKLKWLIQNNKLGKIYYIYSRRTNLGPLRKDVNALWDLAPHDISILNYILGKFPVAVSARGEKFLAHNLEDVCFATLDYPDHILAHVQVSWLDPKKTREIVIVGSRRMAVFDDLNSETPVIVYDKSVMENKFRQNYDTFEEFQMIINNGKARALRVKQQEPLKVECRHFVECIRRQRPALTDGKDGMEVLKVLIGMQHSLEHKGCKVKLKNSKAIRKKG